MLKRSTRSTRRARSDSAFERSPYCLTVDSYSGPKRSCNVLDLRSRMKYQTATNAIKATTTTTIKAASIKSPRNRTSLLKVQTSCQRISEPHQHFACDER